MCGINGVYLRNLGQNDFCLESTINNMNDIIIHRGPDDCGSFFDETNEAYKIGLGHRRLAIIDLKKGHQPIYSTDRKKVIIYNGEVYNFRKLKFKYFTSTEQFSTNTDTEVVLRLYEKFGIDAFSMLEGMFAFSIYDKEKKKIYIVRDYFGEKPLYYTVSKNQIIWASELKSILKVLPEDRIISFEGLNLYFRLTYIPAPYTIYKNIYKLESGHYIEIDCMTGMIDIHEIEYKKHDNKKDISLKEAQNEIHKLVLDSVESRMISDVPVGTFLSGGVDSSIVSYCASLLSINKINTFSIGFEKKEFDETDKSRVVAKLIKSNHHEFIIGEKELLDINDTVLENFDEPFADSSAIATYFVAQKTSDFVKVALTGDGGDEVFGGYNKYYMGKINKSYTNLIPEHLHKSLLKSIDNALNLKNDQRGLKFKIKRLVKSIDYNSDFHFNILHLGFLDYETKDLLINNSYLNDPLKRYKLSVGYKKSSINNFRNIDRILSLEGDMLVKVDRTAMLSSLECRAPFLNKSIWDYTLSLPEKYLINRWDKKHILKKSFAQYFPRDFLNKSKQGFEVPVGDWLRGALKKELLGYLETDFLRKQNIFNEDYIKKIVNDHIFGTADNTFRVWTFFCFQKWYKNNQVFI